MAREESFSWVLSRLSKRVKFEATWQLSIFYSQNGVGDIAALSSDLRALWLLRHVHRHVHLHSRPWRSRLPDALSRQLPPPPGRRDGVHDLPRRAELLVPARVRAPAWRSRTPARAALLGPRARLPHARKGPPIRDEQFEFARFARRLARLPNACVAANGPLRKGKPAAALRRRPGALNAPCVQAARRLAASEFALSILVLASRHVLTALSRPKRGGDGTV